MMYFVVLAILWLSLVTAQQLPDRTTRLISTVATLVLMLLHLLLNA